MVIVLRHHQSSLRLHCYTDIGQIVRAATTPSTLTTTATTTDRTTSEGQAMSGNPMRITVDSLEPRSPAPTIAAPPSTTTNGSTSGATSPTFALSPTSTGSVLRSGISGRGSVSGTTSHVDSLRKRPANTGGGVGGGNSFMVHSHSAAGSLRAQATFSLAAEVCHPFSILLTCLLYMVCECRKVKNLHFSRHKQQMVISLIPLV
jgi:hypothetical protein